TRQQVARRLQSRMVSGIPVAAVRSLARAFGDNFVTRQALERFSDGLAASLDLVLDLLRDCSGVLGDVLADTAVELLLVDLLHVDELQLERVGVPVGGRALEAANVVAASLDVELLVLRVDVDTEAGGGALEDVAVGAEARAVAIGRPWHVVDDQHREIGRASCRE